MSSSELPNSAANRLAVVCRRSGRLWKLHNSLFKSRESSVAVWEVCELSCGASAGRAAQELLFTAIVYYSGGETVSERRRKEESGVCYALHDLR